MPSYKCFLSPTPPESTLLNFLNEFSLQLLTNITSFLLMKEQAQEGEVTCSGLHMHFSSGCWWSFESWAETAE